VLNFFLIKSWLAWLSIYLILITILLLTKNYYVVIGIVIVAIIRLALMPPSIKTAHFNRSHIFIKTYHNRFNQHI
jgi:hypothetical protein